MDPVVTLTALTRVLSTNLVRQLLVKGTGEAEGSDVALSVARLKGSLADLIGSAVRALEVADLADRALVELSVLAESSNSDSKVPPALAVRLRANLEQLVARDIAQAVNSVLDQARVSERDSIAGMSVSELLNRYSTVQHELQLVLNASVHGAAAGASSVGSLVRALTELTYLARTLARVILSRVEESLRVVPEGTYAASRAENSALYWIAIFGCRIEFVSRMLRKPKPRSSALFLTLTLRLTVKLSSVLKLGKWRLSRVNGVFTWPHQRSTSPLHHRQPATLNNCGCRRFYVLCRLSNAG